MIDQTFLWILGVLFYIPFLIFQLKKSQKKEMLLYKSLFFFYILALISVVFFPLPVQSELIRDSIQNDYLKNNFLPFYSIVQISSQTSLAIALRQLGGNILLLLPLGFFIPLLFPKNISFLKALKRELRN